jgi:hypothetical protein
MTLCQGQDFIELDTILKCGVLQIKFPAFPPSSVGRQLVRTLAFRGAGATGAAGATAPIAQTVRGQHGGDRLPFLPELNFEILALFMGI